MHKESRHGRIGACRVGEAAGSGWPLLDKVGVRSCRRFGGSHWRSIAIDCVRLRSTAEAIGGRRLRLDQGQGGGGEGGPVAQGAAGAEKSRDRAPPPGTPSPSPACFIPDSGAIKNVQ